MCNGSQQPGWRLGGTMTVSFLSNHRSSWWGGWGERWPFRFYPIIGLLDDDDGGHYLVTKTATRPCPDGRLAPFRMDSYGMVLFRRVPYPSSEHLITICHVVSERHFEPIKKLNKLLYKPKTCKGFHNKADTFVRLCTPINQNIIIPGWIYDVNIYSSTYSIQTSTSASFITTATN